MSEMGYGHPILESFRRSAIEGDVDAQYELGMFFLRTETSYRSDDEAFLWLRMAAERDHRDANRELGIMYENGRGVPQSYVDAAYHYLRAAKQGDPFSQYCLGYFHEQGLGFEASYETAMFWYGESGKNGFRHGTVGLERVRRKMEASGSHLR